MSTTDSPELSSTEYAILGMLSLQPMSGYDIRKFAAESIGFFWNESYGQIYPALARMQSSGLVESQTPTAVKGRRRQIYSLTARGLAALREWLLLPARIQQPRSETLLKVFFGNLNSPAESMRHIRDVLADESAKLAFYGAVEKQLKQAEQGHAALPYWLIAMDFGRKRSEALVAWCKQSLETLEALAEEKKIAG